MKLNESVNTWGMPLTESNGISNETMEEIQRAVSDAEQAFWEVIAKAFPEIKTGDFPIDYTIRVSNFLEKAVAHWYEINKSHEIDPSVKASEKYGSWYKEDISGYLMFAPMERGKKNPPTREEDWGYVSQQAFSDEEFVQFEKDMEQLFGDKPKVDT